MKHLHTRYKVAIALDGPGASLRLAMKLGTTQDMLAHAAQRADSPHPHKDYGAGRTRRLEGLIEQFIRETFAKHGHLFNLEDQ
jgi:hypothetical protein